MAAMSDYLENKLIDWLLRQQVFTPPTTVYVGLLTAAPSDTGGGTEVTGSNYARAPIACSLANLSGTQGVGTTAISSGASGTTSNNIVVSFNTPSGTWNTVTHFGIYDQSVSGNLLLWGALSASKLIQSGDAVSIQAAQLQIQIDD